jgi:tRNA dimethylallyltransferase
MQQGFMQNKIIVILGPTACGKTSLAVKLSEKFNGEIVSADSRQVYRGLDIGTGKDLAAYTMKRSAGLSTAIPYHLIDVADPQDDFNLAKYQELAVKAIRNILQRGKMPFLVGGSGLYLQAIVDDYQLSEIKPDEKFRQQWEEKSVIEIYQELERSNHKFAEKLNESERNNRRRLIRYLELAKSEKSDIRLKPAKKNRYDSLLLGVIYPLEVVRKRIAKRLQERLEKEDMIGEVERLRAEGVSYEKLENFGLEYKFIAYYLQEKLDYGEMVERLQIAIGQFAKRQITWFKRWEKQGKKIIWLDDDKQAEKIIRSFLAEK